MAHLHPYPFESLLTRMLRELEEKRSVFDLPERKFFLGSKDHDLSVRFHGQTASSPLGPAAGPQSQMAQNLVLSWLGGCRIHELKTVQILDQLEVPRPCIDMQTVGYNVEWSQELRLEQSVEEYVKGSMLIEILRASGLVPLVEGFDRIIFDMSVGYDLQGIQNPRVLEFIRTMKDATTIVDRLRTQIPDRYARYRDLEFETKLSDTLTLSTFHGCPPDEIEKIIDYLLREENLNCVVKLNPMLLGPEKLRGLLHDSLGYEVRVPDTAFEQDASWEQAQGFVERLGETARVHDLGFGVKFSNTLIVENHRDFFSADEKEMYLSGPPLHVLAMHLVGQFRERFGDRYPISFSAGIDRGNFADAVSLGLAPVTVCTDLLKPGGYGRAEAYFRDLLKRMDAAEAQSVDEWVLRAHGNESVALQQLVAEGVLEATEATLLSSRPDQVTRSSWEMLVSRARLLNTETYVATLASNPRYSKEKNQKVPRKIGSHLVLFDCITCDKCVPVCPNDANFTFTIPPTTLAVVKATPGPDGWASTVDGEIRIEMKHQIGNFADFCNDCGNCDIFCPEDGGPYLIKPRFFFSREQWEGHPELDGFRFAGLTDPDVVEARFAGQNYRVQIRPDDSGKYLYEGSGFSITLDDGLPPTTISGRGTDVVDLSYFHLTKLVWDAVCQADTPNYLNVTVG